jgi:hypothetical protein
MRMLTILLLMILCLSNSSCSIIQTKITCEQIALHQISLHRSCDISFDYDRCRCRCFDFNKWVDAPFKSCKEFQDVDPSEIRTVKRDDGSRYEAANFPKEYCNGVSGFFLEDIATDIRPNVKALYQIKENLCE